LANAAASAVEPTMNGDDLDLNRGAVRPVQCFIEGWRLIKDDYWLFMGIAFVGSLIGHAVPLQILLGPMFCGIEICLLRRMRGERVSFNHLFEGFNHFAPSLVATLFVSIPTLIATLLIIVAYFVLIVGVVVPMAPHGGGPPDASFFASFFGVLFGYMAALMFVPFILSAPFIFMYGLIVEHRLSGPQAFLTSLRAVFGNLFGVAGLMLLTLLLLYAGMLVFCVGAYLVLPVMYASYAVAYRQVFPHVGPREVVPVDEAEELEPPAEARPPSTGIRADVPPEAAPETGFTSGPSE
jgi:hypothetical protein